MVEPAGQMVEPASQMVEPASQMVEPASQILVEVGLNYPNFLEKFILLRLALDVTPAKRAALLLLHQRIIVVG